MRICLHTYALYTNTLFFALSLPASLKTAILSNEIWPGTFPWYFPEVSGEQADITALCNDDDSNNTGDVDNDEHEYKDE